MNQGRVGFSQNRVRKPVWTTHLRFGRQQKRRQLFGHFGLVRALRPRAKFDFKPANSDISYSSLKITRMRSSGPNAA
jgi:hypothetical protein